MWPFDLMASEDDVGSAVSSWVPHFMCQNGTVGLTKGITFICGREFIPNMLSARTGWSPRIPMVIRNREIRPPF